MMGRNDAGRRSPIRVIIPGDLSVLGRSRSITAAPPDSRRSRVPLNFMDAPTPIRGLWNCTMPPAQR